MDSLVQIVKEYFVPGSTNFLLIGLAAGIALLFSRKRMKLARIWLICLTGSYWLLSMPVTAAGLESALSGGVPLRSSLPELQKAQAIVILGGGSATLQSGTERVDVLSDSSSLRVLEGIRLYRLLEDPYVIVSGGAGPESNRRTPESIAMFQALVQSGVPSTRIVLESGSGDTHQQAVLLKALLKDMEIHPFILVTSPTHMRRALAAFYAEGLQPIPSASRQHSKGQGKADFPLLPKEGALDRSRNAFREVMALIYYEMRGWSSPQPITGG